MKINKHEFWLILQKSVFFGKMAITFAYELKKIFNIWKYTYAKTYIRIQFLDFQTAKGKYEINQILDFPKKFIFLLLTIY
jgi:hypothetical protein